jgi:hypothetical protein
MKKNHFLNSILNTAAALLIVITLSLTIASPALALDLNPSDYFKFNFAPTAFSKISVSAGESFNAVIKGSADCTKDLPLPISEITITSRVIARPAAGGADLVLNPQYIINIKPLPNKAGESFEINQTVILQFPAGAAPGSYSVIGQVTEAKVTITVIFSYTLDVTGSFPKEQLMGTVKFGAPPAATTPAAIAPPSITIPPASSAPTTTTLITETFPAINTTTLLTIAVIVLGIIVIALIVILSVVLSRRRRGI